MISLTVSALVLTIFPRFALKLLIARFGLAADFEQHIGHVLNGFTPQRLPGFGLACPVQVGGSLDAAVAALRSHVFSKSW